MRRGAPALALGAGSPAWERDVYRLWLISYCMPK